MCEFLGLGVRSKAYDAHLNLVIGDAKEVITWTEIDPETEEEMQKISKREIDLLFVRGDGIILVSPQKTA